MDIFFVFIFYSLLFLKFFTIKISELIIKIDAGIIKDIGKIRL